MYKWLVRSLLISQMQNTQIFKLLPSSKSKDGFFRLKRMTVTLNNNRTITSIMSSIFTKIIELCPSAIFRFGNLSYEDHSIHFKTIYMKIFFFYQKETSCFSYYLIPLTLWMLYGNICILAKRMPRNKVSDIVEGILEYVLTKMYSFCDFARIIRNKFECGK